MILDVEIINEFQIDNIKIDRLITNSIKVLSLVQCIINISKVKNIEIIAEGIEERITYDLLKICGCDIVQGYFIHRPEDINSILKSEVINRLL